MTQDLEQAFTNKLLEVCLILPPEHARSLPTTMEDNYYKKGKESSKSQADQRTAQSLGGVKSRPKTQMNSRAGSSHTLNKQALSSYQEHMGMGRIVESSKNGFAAAHQSQQSLGGAPLHQQHKVALSVGQAPPKTLQSHSILPSTETQSRRISADPAQMNMVRQSAKKEESMSAESTTKRREGQGQTAQPFEQEQVHFATTYQAAPITASNSAASTPLSNMIQKRQFQMTQMAKSNSMSHKAFSNPRQVLMSPSSMQQHQPLTVAANLQKPKITSQGRALEQDSSRKRVSTLPAEMLLDKNVSSLSGGSQPQVHARNSSAQIPAKPAISKPQGGVFQGGSDTMKTVGPRNILTNNFLGPAQNNAVVGSPQFILNSSEKFNFASHGEPGASLGHAPKSAVVSTDKLNNLASLAHQERLKTNQATSAGQNKSGSCPGGMASLSLHHQHSCGAIVSAQASHFNTPSNCYQAQKQTVLPAPISPTPLAPQQDNAAGASSAATATSGSGVYIGTQGPQRSSMPRSAATGDLINVAGHSATNECNAQHLSQNSYEMTAPLHTSTSQLAPVGGFMMNQRHPSNASLIGNLHQHQNSTLVANLASQAQNTSALQLFQQHQTTTANNHSSVVNFTQHTQQAHPNLQAAVQQQMGAFGKGSGLQPAQTATNQSQINQNVGQGHLSASQFDISALLRQQASTTAHQVLDFQELCSNTTHHAGHQTQAALKVSVEASTRDVDFLRQRFFAEYGCDTNDILTLFSYWQSNFQSGPLPVGNGAGAGASHGNQTTAINGLQIGNLSSYRPNPAHHHTITGPSGTKSNNVTAFGLGLGGGGKSRHTTVNQHQTINFNSQSFDNQTMTTSHIQPRKAAKQQLLELQSTVQSNPNGVTAKPSTNGLRTVQMLKEGGTQGLGQDSTEIQHFTTGSLANGYTPFDGNQQMFFVAPQGGGNPGAVVSSDLQHLKGRRTQPCIRQHSTASNRQNCTDTVSFHRDVPTPMMQREALASVEAEDDKNEFSFEEPAIDATNEQNSIEDEEKSLINALSFKKKVAPLADGQNLHEIDNQPGWATAKQEISVNPVEVPKDRHATRPLSKDTCGFTIQLSPINRFAPSPRSKRSVFDFYALRNSKKSLLSRGIQSAKRRIKKRGSTNKEGARKFLHKQLLTQSKALSVLTRPVSMDQNALFRLKTALSVIYLQNGTTLSQIDQFKKMLPRQHLDSSDNKVSRDVVTTTGEKRNFSEATRRRDKSTKARNTSKSRKRQGSRNSRKQRIASLYRESTSSIGEESASFPVFTHMSKDGVVGGTGAGGMSSQGEVINVIRPQGVVVQDAETTQDIQKLCKEIEDAEKNFASKLEQDEDNFEKQMTRQVVQAERALQESKRESQTRELSMRGSRRESHLSIAERTNFKAQSMSSLNQAMQRTPVGLANATQRLLNPSELYGTQNHNMAQLTRNEADAPNTERPNAQSIELRLASHHQTLQKKRGTLECRNGSADVMHNPGIKAQDSAQLDAKGSVKGKRLNVVSLLDQKSEPCLLKPKKLALDPKQVKLFSGATGTGGLAGSIAGEADGNTKTPTERKANVQSTSSLKRKLTFIKTKNINFHSVSKLSGGRLQASATSTHQAAPGLRIKLQKTDGESTDRSGQEMRFAGAQTTCQSALATHKHKGSDLRTLPIAPSSGVHLGQPADNLSLKDYSESGVTPGKSTGKVKYASARIKLLRMDPNSQQQTGEPSKLGQLGLSQQQTTAKATLQHAGEASPTSSGTSTLAGVKSMRRLVEMLINEYYRKRGKSIKTVSQAKQVDTLVDFWWQSLSQQKILCKLKGKQAKAGLVEKEKHLMNYLNGSDMNSLFQLQKHSTTRKYGELAVMDEALLREALQEYLNMSQ